MISSGRKILVVDDDDRIRLFVSRVLSADGHTPLLAKDGEEALQVLSSEVPALILLDINMPVMGGVEFIHQFENKLDIPIVVLSATTLDEDALAGVGGYLPKPFSIADLRAAILKHEGRRS